MHSAIGYMTVTRAHTLHSAIGYMTVTRAHTLHSAIGYMTVTRARTLHSATQLGGILASGAVDAAVSFPGAECPLGLRPAPRGDAPRDDWPRGDAPRRSVSAAGRMGSSSRDRGRSTPGCGV